MRTYIGLDGKSYSSIDEVMKVNKEIRTHPLYIKEMNRRRVANIPGEITRDQWAVLIGGGPVDPVVVEKEETVVLRKAPKKYQFQISDMHRSLLKSANRKGLKFELTQDQIDSLLEKKCYFCGHKSETIIIVGDRFDYESSRGVCGTCKKVHDLLGDEMHEYLDRFMQ